MNHTSKYFVNLHSIERCWPVGHDIPALLVAFAKLIASWDAGCMGHFQMNGNRLDDYWIEYGGELSEYFANFITLSDGTRIAVWLHDNANRGAEPVIELGGEGDLVVLAPNLRTFLQQLAAGTAHRELRLDTAVAPTLAAQQLRQIAEVMADAVPHPSTIISATPTNFMEDWQRRATADIAADPTLHAIAACLQAHKPTPENPTGRTHIHWRIAGDRVELQTDALPPDYTTFAALPERDALIPLVLRAREERPKLHPERGLWHSASLEFHSDGQLFIKASWEFEPEFRSGGRMTKADLARYPRSPRWIESWMYELR
jgi:hypothetical protein